MDFYKYLDFLFYTTGVMAWSLAGFYCISKVSVILIWKSLAHLGMTKDIMIAYWKRKSL